MKNVIILEKEIEKKELLTDILDNTVPAKKIWLSSFVNFAKIYKWIMSNANFNIVKKSGLTNIKKKREIG